MMDKSNKKDLELNLIKQTEKILQEIDPSAATIFSKNIRSHCKDLAKKFLKTQKKLNKQKEELNALAQSSLNATPLKKESPKAELKPKLPNHKIKVVSKTKTALSNTSAEAPVKSTQKRVRRGNNLMNAVAVQKKAKASLMKNISNSKKK
jgi:hypothetical protein